MDGRRVAELLYAGELDAGTPVSKDDGERWALVSEVPAFVVHAKKARKKLEESSGRSRAPARSRSAAGGSAWRCWARSGSWRSRAPGSARGS
ncbi:MAG: hypothetical protein QM704_18095 [Anaeromyxobacteraceae bacterium]